MTRESAEALVARMFPHVPHHAALIVDQNIEIAQGLAMNADADPEIFAVALANRHGAFPWNGPYGNGLSKRYYQGKFREMAVEHLAILKELES